jgi:hypothetical protein
MNSITKNTKSIPNPMGHNSLARQSIWLVLVAGLVLAGTASAQDSSWVPWGKQKNGLSMAVYPVSPRIRQLTGIRFNVALQNTGKTDLDVNLGTSVGNGRMLYPDKIALVLSDEDRPRTLALRETKEAASGATPLIVRIAAGSKYSFSVNLDDYWFPPSGKFDTKLKPGYYAIEARFTGGATAQPVATSASNASGPAAFWTGSIKSKRLRFSVGPGYAYGYYPRPRFVRYWPYGPYPYPPYGYPPYPPPPPPPPAARNQQQQDQQQQDQQQQDQQQPQQNQPPQQQ